MRPTTEAPGVIDRDRLTRDILATPAGAMCLLQAPRGYGVTTALTRAMAAAEGPVRWVDASGLTQVGSLTAAVGAWADEKWLVIDGVGDPSLVGADLADLAGVIPDDARVAVGGTVPLGMLVLDQPWSNLLDRGTLAFTDDEAMALLMALAPAVDPAELSLVSRWCEGWAAALVLAASRLRRGAQDTEEWLRATGPEVLVGRWFEAQPDHVRRFLLDTALLDDLLVGPCDAVRDATDSGHILAGFDTAEGPVARAGAGAGGHSRWRRHRLLTELLRARTPVTQSHRWAHRQAAAWFVAHSDVGQAIHHLIEAGEHRDAGTLLRDHEGDLLSSGAIATTLDWYSRMPATAWDAAAEHELRLGWGRLLVGDVSGARDNLARVNLVVGVSVDSLPGESSGGLDLPREAALLRAFIAAAQGDTAEMIVAADQATEAFAGDTAENAGQLAPVALARGLLWQGEVPRANRVVSGIEQLRYPNAILREVALRGVQAACAVAEGRISVAESIVEAGLTWLSERGRDALDLRQYTFVVAQALTRTESGDLATGRAIAEAAVAAAQGNAAVGDLTFARLAQTRALALMGQVPVALETIRQARDDLWSACPHSAMATVLLWAEADALIRAGDHMRAERVVRALPVSESRTMLAARVLGPHQPARVARVMTNLRATSPAVEAHRRLQLAECYVTTDAGLRGSHLVQGARLAHQHGMAMILLDHPRLVELARKLANRDPDVALSRLIAAADGTRTYQMGEVVPVGAPLALSAGELELLRWLPGRQTRADIAEGLGISVNTVKTRMQRLFRKLDVSTRDEAIAAARRRGLLPP